MDKNKNALVELKNLLSSVNEVISQQFFEMQQKIDLLERKVAQLEDEIIFNKGILVEHTNEEVEEDIVEEENVMVEGKSAMVEEDDMVVDKEENVIYEEDCDEKFGKEYTKKVSDKSNELLDIEGFEIDDNEGVIEMDKEGIDDVIEEDKEGLDELFVSEKEGVEDVIMDVEEGLTELVVKKNEDVSDVVSGEQGGFIREETIGEGGDVGEEHGVEEENFEIEGDSKEIVLDKVKPDWYDWEVDYPGTHLDDISLGIGYNDRLIFIKELFYNSEDEYKRTIAELNGMERFKEAVEYIRTNFPDWDEESEEVYKFYMSVRRKLK